MPADLAVEFRLLPSANVEYPAVFAAVTAPKHLHLHASSFGRLRALLAFATRDAVVEAQHSSRNRQRALGPIRRGYDKADR